MSRVILLDTHVVVRWLAAPPKLSREQLRLLRAATRNSEPLAVSAVSLLEIAVLFGEGATRLKVPADELLSALDSGSGFSILPSASKSPPKLRHSAMRYATRPIAQLSRPRAFTVFG